MKFFLAIFLLGLAFIAGTLYTLYEAAALLRRGVDVEARVVRIEYEPSSKKRQEGFYHPVIEYVIDGKPYSQRSATGYGTSPYAEGQVLRLTVDPLNPSEFATPDFASRWGAPLVLGIFGVAFTALGGWLLRTQSSA